MIPMLLASAALASPLPEPISAASAGKVQCYAPNRATRSCRSLAAYEFRPDGGIQNPVTVLVSATPAITMRTVTRVTIKSGRVCGVLRAEDVDTAEFMIGGVRASAARTATLRQRLKAAQQNLFGHEICTAYVPWGDGLIAKASIDGADQPAMDQEVLWVSPTDGFKVRP